MNGAKTAGKGKFFSKYRAIIIFNRNLIIAGLAGVLAGALASQLYSSYDKENEFANSAITLVTEYGVYIPVFTMLFYLSNRHKYKDPLTGRISSKLAKDDIKRLLATFSVSEVVYSVTKIVSQYQLLQFDMQAYEASIASSMIAWITFLVAVNSLAKVMKLLKNTGA